MWPLFWLLFLLPFFVVVVIPSVFLTVVKLTTRRTRDETYLLARPEHMPFDVEGALGRHEGALAERGFRPVLGVASPIEGPGPSPVGAATPAATTSGGAAGVRGQGLFAQFYDHESLRMRAVVVVIGERVLTHKWVARASWLELWSEHGGALRCSTTKPWGQGFPEDPELPHPPGTEVGVDSTSSFELFELAHGWWMNKLPLADPLTPIGQLPALLEEWARLRNERALADGWFKVTRAGELQLTFAGAWAAGRRTLSAFSSSALRGPPPDEPLLIRVAETTDDEDAPRIGTGET